MKKIKHNKTFYDQSISEIAILYFLRKQDSHLSEKQQEQVGKRNFLQIVDAFHYNDCLYIITEQLSLSLYDKLIKPKTPPSLKDLQRIIYDVLICLKFLKICGIIHCDVKPENILFKTDNPKNGVKLIDFGSATFANDVDYDYLQTRPYRAPEITLGLGFGFNADMWSLGCVIYEMITSRVLFRAKESVQENLAKAMAIDKFWFLETLASKAKAKKEFVFGNALKVPIGGNGSEQMGSEEWMMVVPKGDYDFEGELMSEPYQADPLIVDFIRSCLVVDPEKRMRVEEALNHPFFKKQFN